MPIKRLVHKVRSKLIALPDFMAERTRVLNSVLILLAECSDKKRKTSMPTIGVTPEVVGPGLVGCNNVVMAAEWNEM